jgi:hypothetical protein
VGHPNCVICGGSATPHFEREVLGRHRARYFHCPHCVSIFVAEPHWLPEAYAEALNAFDTGSVARNLGFARLLTPLLYLHCGPDFRYLDHGAGYGLLVRMMRDIGFDYRWQDLHARNLFARGFEGQDGDRYAAVSAFEVLEHLVDPSAEIARLADMADTLVFSTELWSGRPPQPEEWYYFAFQHGQHVMFYSRRTLEHLATRHGYRLISDGRGFHVMTRRPDPGGIVEAIVSRGRVGRARLAARAAAGPPLPLPSFLVTGTAVSLRHLDRAVRRRMTSRTISDHELLLSQFASTAGAGR